MKFGAKIMKKSLKKFLVLALILPVVLIFTACGATSAYDVAVKNGFEGTEQEWLDSLKGKSAYDIAVDKGFTGTEQDWLNSLKGKDGTNGTNGTNANAVDTYQAWQDACNDPDNPYSGSYIDFLKEIIGETNYDNTATIINKCTLSVFKLDACKNSYSYETHKMELTPVLSGSAVLYKFNTDGTSYVVTNCHMTNKSIEAYMCTFYEDANAFEVTYVGGVKTYDIAVFKINKQATDYLKSCGAEPVTLGEHFLGEDCFSVGNTAGEGIAVSKGIVSRESEIVTYSDYDATVRTLRHDTYISHGNSGGALFDMEGRLIGLTNGGQGQELPLMNYAIPTSIAAGVANNIIYNYEVYGISIGRSFGQLGLELKTQNSTTSYITDTGRIVISEDVIIDSIESDSVAARLQDSNLDTEEYFMANDKLVSVKIVQLNATYKITRSFNLSEALLNARVGDTLIITIERGGVQKTISIALTSSDTINF